MNKKRRVKKVVVLAINDFLIGGAQRLIVDLFQKWNPNVYEFHLLTFREFPDKKDFFGQLPVDIKKKHIAVQGIRDINGVLKVRKYLKSLNPDVVISNLYLSNTITRLSLLGCRTPIITVEHNTYTNKNIFQHVIDWLLSYKSSRIVAVSDGVAEFLLSSQHISRNKISVIANGVNLGDIRANISTLSRASIRKSLGILANDVVVLHVGRLVSQKDPLLVVRAYACFARNQAQTSRLIVVGDGDMRYEMSAEAERLGLEHEVFFVGEQSPHEFYMASDVFLSTSLIEGFGLVRAEALAYGVPVVTTGTGGSDELIESQKNGIVVASRNPDELARGITDALAIPREVFLASADRTVRLFSIEATAEAYEHLIEDIACLP